MMTSDLPLLGEKKSWDGEDCGSHFSLVWFGLLQAMATSDLPLLGEKKSRDGEHCFGLVWFGLVFPSSNDDL